MMVMVMASLAVIVASQEMLEVVVVVLLLEKCQTQPSDDVDVGADEVEGSQTDQYWLDEEDVEIG
jgi:hypothetical protein